MRSPATTRNAVVLVLAFVLGGLVGEGTRHIPGDDHTQQKMGTRQDRPSLPFHEEVAVCQQPRPARSPEREHTLLSGFRIKLNAKLRAPIPTPVRP